MIGVSFIATSYEKITKSVNVKYIQIQDIEIIFLNETLDDQHCYNENFYFLTVSFSIFNPRSNLHSDVICLLFFFSDELLQLLACIHENLENKLLAPFDHIAKATGLIISYSTITHRMTESLRLVFVSSGIYECEICPNKPQVI